MVVQVLSGHCLRGPSDQVAGRGGTAAWKAPAVQTHVTSPSWLVVASVAQGDCGIPQLRERAWQGQRGLEAVGRWGWPEPCRVDTAQSWVHGPGEPLLWGVRVGTAPEDSTGRRAH